MLQRLNLTVASMRVSEMLVRPGEDDKWDLDAPYQRQSVWDLERQRGLVKSLYCKLPIPAIVYADLFDFDQRTNYFRVVDGKQRVLTFRAWFNDGFTIPGEWFDLPGEPVYHELPEFVQRSFRERNIPTAQFDSWRQYQTDSDGQTLRDGEGRAVIRTGTVDDMLAREAELYIVINRGGVAHTDADLAVAQRIVLDASKEGTR